MTLRKAYWRIADGITFPLALVAALGALESSYSYGYIGAFMADMSIAQFTACESE